MASGEDNNGKSARAKDMVFAEQLKPLLDWLYLHPHWAGVATFAVSFVESLAIIGVLVPGIFIMIAIGALVGTGIVPAWEIILYAIFGAILGDAISYWIGRRYHERVPEIWPFSRFPMLFTKGKNFFQRHGGKSVLLGRLAGPVRVVTPIIAGMLDMPAWRFLFATTIGSTIWAISYMMPGILLAAASQGLPPGIAKQFLLGVAITLLGIGGIYWLIKRIAQWIRNLFHNTVNFLWYLLETTSSLRSLHFLLRNKDPNDATPLSLALGFIFSTLALIILAIQVKHQSALIAFNESMLHLLRTLRTPFLDHFMIAFTYLGELKVLGLLWAALTLGLIWQGHRRAAIYWFANGLLAFVSVQILKYLIQSPRPEVLYIIPNGWSFPSGHAALSVAFFGFLSVLIARSSQLENRWISYVCAIFLAAFVCFSRLYLDAHWLTDVLGGILLGLSCVFLIVLGYQKSTAARIPIIKILLMTGCLLFVGWGVQFLRHYQQDLYGYSLITQPSRTIDGQKWWLEHDTLPLIYRTNRFGKPIQVMNIEWVGTIIKVEQSLIAQGWKKESKATLPTAMNNLVNKNNHRPLLLNLLYQEHKPALIMTKFSSVENKLLILRLWDAHITLTATTHPLWIGTISYYRPWSPIALLKNKKIAAPTAHLSALDALKADIGKSFWKTKTVPHITASQFKTKSDPDWNGSVLLIKSTK